MNTLNYFQEITGMTDPAAFTIAFAFGCIGMILSLLWQSSRRDKQSKATPYRFSLRFLVKDNLLRIITSVLLLFIGIRFAKELLGQEVTTWVALIIGLSLDKISELIKNLTLSARD